MKKFILLLFVVSFIGEIWSENSLVVYFSATGTTKQVAEKMAKVFDAHLWEIEAYEPYTAADLNWRDSMSRASLEYSDPTYRPTIKMCTDIRPYTTIYLGFPIWWNCCPRIIQSWIENNDLTEKTLILFATSSRTSIDGSLSHLRKTYPQYNWLTGRTFKEPTETELLNWKKAIEEQRTLMNDDEEEESVSQPIEW